MAVVGVLAALVLVRHLEAGPALSPLRARIVALACAGVFPLTAADIIEADDWLIEQPWPEMRRSLITPSPTSR